MKILSLNVYRKYFDQIYNKTKTTEYRDVTPYWSKRLEGRKYDAVKFRNGYAKIAPEMLVEIKCIGKVTFQTTSTYAIDLGDILKVDNYNPISP